MTLRSPMLPLCAATVLGLSAAPASAQLRCDCTEVVGSCAADVFVRGSLIEITTDRAECARVDYLVDGQPFVSLVVDGESTQSWPAPTASPEVSVESCRVCRDTAPAAAGPAQLPPGPGPDGGSGPLRALIQVEPEYPESALERGVQGHVELELQINEQGAVVEAAVTEAAPQGVFDAAARAAVMRWRYSASPGGGTRTVTERIEFRIPLPSLPRTVARRPEAVTERDGPRNACVREGSRFNYGDHVEIGLINACDAPLVVFGCVQGSGQYQSRWNCTTNENGDQLLVGGNDERVGETGFLGSTDEPNAVRFTDRFLISRAPNTEYWWLACTVDDAPCLEAARSWVRSLDGQSASANPQSRSRVPLARSY